jgi:hypothetical protein
VRIDPLDISVCYVYDAKREIWVEGVLQEPRQAMGRTLNQWITISRLSRRLEQEKKLEREEALARAFDQIDVYVRQRVAERNRGLAPRRFAAFVSSQSAWAKIRPARFDEDHDAPGGHSLELDENDTREPPKRAHFEEPKRRWKQPEDREEHTPEDDARAAEFGQRAEEQANEDVVVSPDAPTDEHDAQAAAAESPDRSDDDVHYAERAAEQTEEPESVSDDDDDDDDVPPVGYGRD